MTPVTLVAIAFALSLVVMSFGFMGGAVIVAVPLAIAILIIVGLLDFKRRRNQAEGLQRFRERARPRKTELTTARDRQTLSWRRQVVADPSLFLTRSTLVAHVPAANARSRHLDADDEGVIVQAVAATRHTDPTTDVYARVVARAA
jgi:hypothetical protein